MRLLRRILLVLTMLLVAVLLVGAGWCATHRDQVRGMRQAAVVGGTLSGNAHARRAVGPFAHDVQPLVVETAGQLPSTYVLPAVEDRVPAIAILVPNGTTAAQDEDLADVQRALAAAGLAGWAIRVPSDEELLVDPDAAQRIVDAIAHVGAHQRVRDRRVSIVAAGPAASVAINHVAAGTVDASVPAIVAAMPIADVQSLMRAALVDPNFDPQLRRDIGRALVRAAVRLVPADASVVHGVLDRAARADDPITALRGLPSFVVPPAYRGLFATLRATTPEAFDAAWRDMPGEIRDAAAGASAGAGSRTLDARVVVALVDGHVATEQIGVREVARSIRDVRSVRIEPAATADSIDARALFDVSAWWLRRAGA